MENLGEDIHHFLRRHRGRVFGRVVRSRQRPDRLALETGRKIAMVMGPSGLGRLHGGTDDILRAIGYTGDYIERQKQEGMHFYLIQFSFLGGHDMALRPRLATWENVLDECAMVYPQGAKSFAEALPALSTMTFSQVEKALGFSLAAVDRLGESDWRFVNVERFLQSDMAPLMVRRFLYHVCRISDLYSGDGWTYTEAGTRVLKEYVMPNLFFEQLVGYQMHVLG